MRVGAAMSTSKASKKSTVSPTNGSSQNKVVGPNIKGNLEEYQLVMHLQSALFGGVYEAKGRSTGKDFAIKVLHKSELQKVEENKSIEFCEVPLSEIKFADVMQGHEHVMEVEEHFEDQYCHYCVFELCRGGDLLEALKQKPMGFDERHAQFLIRQAALGLTYLHDRGVAMQDVSLENMLLNVNPGKGNWQVKICDPGQAVHFQTDAKGLEVPVNFHGLVGKSFRPPELHEHKSYLATKVDSWCLGWSTFYLLTAQPLFMSADPAQKDADWHLFKNGKFDELFKTKTPSFSAVGIDFIFKLMQMEPSKRMSIADCCKHAWLSDTGVPPMMAPKEMLTEELRKKLEEERRAKTMLPVNVTDREFKGGSLSASTGGVPTTVLPTVSSPIMRPMTHTLPTWSAAPIQGIITKPQMTTPHTPLMRVRSPSGRSPRSSAPTGPSFADLSQQASDRRSRVFQPHRSTQRTAYAGGYVVATAHSPAPMARGSSGALSPAPEKCMAASFYGGQESNRISFVSTPRASHRRSAAAPAPIPMVEAESRGRPLWAFGQKAEGPPRRWGSNGSDYQVSPAPRAASPVPVAIGAVTRVASPPPAMGLAFIPPMLSGIGSSRRAHSPRAVYQVSRSPSPVPLDPDMRAQPVGFSWTPVAMSPRAPASVRAPSPTRMAHPTGFAWRPEAQLTRAFSPAPSSITFPRPAPTIAHGYHAAQNGHR